jgi:hypothetical protein
MGLSIRAYARHRGISDAAVRKAIKAGRITLEADGTLDPVRADADWQRNTDGVYRRSGEGPQFDVPTHGPAGDGARLTQARTVNEVVKAQTNKVRLARLKGELVDRNQAVAHVFKLARTERDAWLNWPARISAQMAAQLGVDPHAMHIALEAAVREHLQELGDLHPRVDG